MPTDLSPEQDTSRDAVKPTTLPALQVAGLAHDFKNLLAAIIGNIALAQSKINQQTACMAHLLSAEKASRRALCLANSLLNYAHYGNLADQNDEEVANIISETAQFTLAGSSIDLQLDVPTTLGLTPLGTLQLTQILQNLLVNAQQAMSNKGTIAIQAQAIDSRKEKEITGLLHKGTYLRLEIKDSGEGISSEKLPHIFEKGFSTKTKGHGLGLWQCKQLIEEKGGQIRVKSTLGEGSTFTLYLPLRPFAAKTSQAQKALSLRKKRGRILILDDDELLRELASEMLRTLGYEPEAVGKGEDALTRYQQARETGTPFESVILDLSVPGALDGKAVLDRLRAYDPNVKAILSTGHTHHNLVKDFEGSGFSGCVLKPYQMQDLDEALNHPQDKSFASTRAP